MIVLRTAGEVQSFLCTPLGRETEPIIAPHLERLAEYEFEEVATVAVCEADESVAVLGLDPEAYEFREDHPGLGFREEAFVTGQDGSGWLILTRL